MDMSLALVDVTTAVAADDKRTLRIGLCPLFNGGDSVIVVFVAGGESKGGKEHETCHHSQQKKSLFRHFFMFLMFLFSCLFTLNILNIRIFQQDCMLWTRLFNNAKIYIIFHIQAIFIHFFSQDKVKNHNGHPHTPVSIAVFLPQQVELERQSGMHILEVFHTRLQPQVTP